MSRKYKFHNPDGICFVMFAVIRWIDSYGTNQPCARLETRPVPVDEYHQKKMLINDGNSFTDTFGIY